MRQYVKIGLVGVVVLASAACAPASGARAPANAPAPPAEALVTDDVIGATLEREGLLGALARIDAELGPTLVSGSASDKPIVIVEDVERERAKLPPAPSFADEPVVTWGEPSLYGRSAQSDER